MTDWQGEFYFGDWWGAFRGAAGDNHAHAHATLQITLAHDDDIIILDADGRRRSGRTLVVRPQVSHSLERNNQVTLVLIEPQTLIARSLLEEIGRAEIAPLPASITARLDLRAPLSACLTPLSRTSVPPVQVVDARLQQAIEYLNARQDSASLSSTAKACGISEARLREIAIEQLGVPLSKWIIWRKLRRASQALATGAPPAEAAVAGGFADQAHFTRTMKKVIGLTPRIASEPLR